MKINSVFLQRSRWELREKASYQVSINLAAKAWFSRPFPSFHVILMKALVENSWEMTLLKHTYL